tara:strand:- start:1347 stop:2510 length:1164 start_codon:yes stop_codon:yes gene_type:complete
MKNLFSIILSYLLISFNTYVFSIENKDDNLLKIGVLAPFSGEFKDLGEKVLYSVNLALHDIGDKSIKIYPKDSGSNKKKILKSCEEFRSEGIKIIIGPTDSTFIKELNNFDDLIFLSLSNIDSNFKNNVIMMGINLESQLIAIKKFIEKNKKKKTVILYPDNSYAKHVEKNLNLINFKNKKFFKYSKDPKKLTSQIEKLTNYKQRKINLESRIKKLEKSDLNKDLKELNMLKQKHTLGKVNFDSIIIIDFGSGLKSILTSLAYTDVLEQDVLIIAANQWFDDNILKESSVKNFYFPSIDLKNLEKFRKKFHEFYDYKPSDITILSYDSVGLVYYFWKKNIKINSTKDFNMKNEIKGKIGKFKISENKVIQKLSIYNLNNNAFVKSNL